MNYERWLAWVVQQAERYGIVDSGEGFPVRAALEGLQGLESQLNFRRQSLIEAAVSRPLYLEEIQTFDIARKNLVYLTVAIRDGLLDMGVSPEDLPDVVELQELPHMIRAGAVSMGSFVPPAPATGGQASFGAVQMPGSQFYGEFRQSRAELAASLGWVAAVAVGFAATVLTGAAAYLILDQLVSLFRPEVRIAESNSQRDIAIAQAAQTQAQLVHDEYRACLEQPGCNTREIPIPEIPDLGQATVYQEGRATDWLLGAGALVGLGALAYLGWRLKK